MFNWGANNVSTIDSCSNGEIGTGLQSRVVRVVRQFVCKAKDREKPSNNVCKLCAELLQYCNLVSLITVIKKK